jgi:hypothetical protein
VPRSQGVGEPRCQGAKEWRSRGAKERRSGGALDLYLHYCIPRASNSSRSESWLHLPAPWLLRSSAPSVRGFSTPWLLRSAPWLLGTSTPWLLHSSAPPLVQSSDPPPPLPFGSLALTRLIHDTPQLLTITVVQNLRSKSSLTLATGARNGVSPLPL